MDRRAFLRTGLVATAAFTTVGSSFWRALADHAEPLPGEGPYGPLGPADANGIRLPAGFSSREIARARAPVAGTPYVWHIFPDGGATYATPDRGWIYVSNSEVPVAGGAGAVRFAEDGRITDAYPILVGTSVNCSGGPTPWGTWLSCEEHDAGHVWECDPTGKTPGLIRPALGTFKHEAACVDPVGKRLYLTEDQSDSRFYRFTPDAYPDLTTGVLEVARVEAALPQLGGAVTWLEVPYPNIVGGTTPTRSQVPASTGFRRGEGAFFDLPSRTVFFCTTSDHRIWAYHADTETIEVWFDGRARPDSPLRGPDNITISPSGDIFICEDGGNMEIVMISREGVVAPVVQVTGQGGSEMAGVAFDPGGTRMYFSSQRGADTGITYEVSGPFRKTAP